MWCSAYKRNITYVGSSSGEGADCLAGYLVTKVRVVSNLDDNYLICDEWEPGEEDTIE